jgi:preprotein translocase subunit SecB
MSDPFSTGSPFGAGAPPEPPQLGILAQYVKDLSFENPAAPQSLQPSQQPPQVQVNVDVGGRALGGDAYESTLQINARGVRGSETIFVVELTYAGLFQLRGFPEDQLQAVLLIECPRILFPFARAVIADATRDGGFPPLMINPIDFAQMMMRQQQPGGPGGFGGNGPGPGGPPPGMPNITI